MGLLKRIFGRDKKSEERELTPEEMTQLIREHRKAKTQDMIRQARISSGQVYANGTPRPRNRASEIKDIGNFL